MSEVEQFMRNRDLVSIRRETIDGNSIQGFVLAASDTLVVLQYVYDFHLDGLMVLRREDISDIYQSETDEFQQQLLQQEGLLQQVPFDLQIDASSWNTVLPQLSASHQYLIVESELVDEPDFLIGKMRDLTETDVTFDTFSGAARWYDEASSMPLSDITSCQVGTNYINVYRRHLEMAAGRGLH